MLNGLIAPEKNGILLPATGPFGLRFNCSAGQLALSERNFISESGKLVILHYDNWFGSLGKTENEFWTRVVCIAHPSLVADSKGKVPSGTVCEAFLKGESRDLFSQAATVAVRKFGLGLAQLVCSFTAQPRQNAKGSYAAFAFDFSEPEKADSAFMGEILAFAQGVDEAAVQSFKAPGLVGIDGMAPSELALLKAHHASAVVSEPMAQLPALNAA